MWIFICLAVIVLLVVFHKVRAHSRDNQIRLYIEHMGGIEKMYATLIEKLAARLVVDGHTEDIVKEVISFKEIRISNPLVKCRYIVKSIYGGAFLVRYDQEKMLLFLLAVLFICILLMIDSFGWAIISWFALMALGFYLSMLVKGDVSFGKGGRIFVCV